MSTSSYNGATGNWELANDGTGWSRVAIPLSTPPSGTDKAIYIVRAWYESIADADTVTTLTWDVSHYWGFKFDANHISDPDGDATAANEWVLYKDFFGFGAVKKNGFSPSGAKTAVMLSDGDYAEPSRNTDFSSDDFYLNLFEADGTLGTAASLSSAGESPRDPSALWAIGANSTFGPTDTKVLSVYSDLTDESVYLDFWNNRGSFNLDTFNIATDLDPNSPKTSIPASNELTTKTINGAAVTGTNWRPSSGVMGFPTHFIASYPLSDQKLVISHVGVQYSTSNVVT